MPHVPDHQPFAPVLSYASSTGKLICDPMRSGRFVVVGEEVSLPPRCVLCNTPSEDPPLRLKLHRSADSFHYEGVGLELRLLDRRAKVSLSYCRRHLRRRRIALAAITVLAIGILATAIIGIYGKTHWLYALGDRSSIAGVALLLGVGIVTVIGIKSPRCHHFQDGYYYLEGFGRPFLESLPEAPSTKNSPPRTPAH